MNGNVKLHSYRKVFEFSRPLFSAYYLNINNTVLDSSNVLTVFKFMLYNIITITFYKACNKLKIHNVLEFLSIFYVK